MQKNTERRDAAAKNIGARREHARAAAVNQPAATGPNGRAGVDDAPQNTATEMRRLVHKAAWTRMFGHAERRNPYSK